MFKSLVFFALSCAALVPAQAHPLEARHPQEPATSTFSLYAYGEGISGLRVFYADGTLTHSTRKRERERERKC